MGENGIEVLFDRNGPRWREAVDRMVGLVRAATSPDKDLFRRLELEATVADIVNAPTVEAAAEELALLLTALADVAETGVTIQAESLDLSFDDVLEATRKALVGETDY